MAILRQVKMQNCQCWKSPKVINFSPGLNVIRSTNNSVGKSVLFKGLKLTITPYMFDKEDREDFITYQQEYAEITYLFDTDEVAIVRIFPQRTLYFYSPSLQNPKFTQTVDSPPEPLIKALSVLVEPVTGYIINVIDSERSLFLVDSENETNVNIIKFMTEDKTLTRLKETYETRTIELNDSLAKVYRKELEYRDRINKLDVINVKAYEEKINLAEKLSNVFDAMVKIYSAIDKVPKSRKSVSFYSEQIALCDLAIDLSNTGIFNVKPVSCKVSEKDITLANTLVEFCNTGIFDIVPVRSNITDKDIQLADMIKSINESNIFNVNVGNKVISNSDINLATVAENLERFIVDITFEEKPFKNYKECLKLVEVLQTVMQSYNSVQSVKRLNRIHKSSLNRIESLTSTINLAEKVFPLEDALNSLQLSKVNYNKALNTIHQLEDELDNLANNNEVLECPVHGKIINKNGVCIPVLKTSSNISIVPK